MKHIKITAGFAHVNYGGIADLTKEVSDAEVDCIHPGTVDVRNPQNMKLMGGHQIVAGIRPETDRPIECHIYIVSMDEMFIEQIDETGADILIILAEHFTSIRLAYIINWCHERYIKVGLILGCYTPLCLAEEGIYNIDRLHIVTHDVNETDGEDSWGWRKSAIDLVQRARKMIDKKNLRCELAVDGGLRADNMDRLIERNPDVIVLSGAVFKDPDGATAGVKKCGAAIDAAAEKYGLE